MTTDRETPAGAVPSVNHMDEDETALADAFYDAINTASRTTPRSQQAGLFQVGVSDLGFCPERTRRMLAGQTPEPTDLLPAWIGTELGRGLEEAWIALHPDWVRQAEVAVDFKILIGADQYQVRVPGHPDLIDPTGGLMLDVKTTYGLADAERNGPSRSQQFQRHLYGVGAWNAGLFAPGIELADVRVGNVWIDRSAVERRAHVNIEPLNLDVVAEAQEWLEDVVYHLVNDQEAEKVPPRDMCAKVCGYFEPCRGGDTDVEGLIEDPEWVRFLELYREGQRLESDGKKFRAMAKAHLEGVRGTVMLQEGLFSVRETWKNPTVVPEHVRSGYTTLELKPVKGARGTR